MQRYKSPVSYRGIINNLNIDMFKRLLLNTLKTTLKQD